MSTSRPLQYWGVGVALSEEESFEGGVELGWISVVDNRRGGGECSRSADQQRLSR